MDKEIYITFQKREYAKEYYNLLREEIEEWWKSDFIIWIIWWNDKEDWKYWM